MKTGSFLRGLKYLHIKGAHAPVCTNENLEATRNTDVIRQLRGSLRILELLIQRMKELGIYEQAMIVVAGDHSERYSPEIVALVKRPGEIHNDMQFHSLPCQISDLAGTVLAEKKLRPSDLSLFRVHPVSGTCEMRSDVQSSVLQISNWSKKHDFSIAAAGTSNVHTHPFLTADQRICIPTERNQPPPAAIAFRAQLLDSVDCWETDLIPLKEQTTTHYYQLAMQGLPDGNYLMLQVEKTASSCSNYFSETSPMDNLQISRLPFYLTLRHGQPALCKNCSGSNIRPLQINEKLIFEEWKAYPQLCLSDDCHFTTHGLSLTESSVLEVNLPESSKPMTLQMEIKMNTINAGTLELYDEQTVLIRKNIKCQNYELFTIEFSLPEKIAAKHNLKLQFRYSRNLKNRGRKNVPTIFLTSLILKEN